MIDDMLTRLFSSELVVFLVVMALMLAFAEIGFRLRLRLHATKEQARKGQIGAIQGAVLGLLGLLLGFTFAMAVERYDTRRGLVVQEANAIGTTYLRASLLPDAHQSPVKDLLRRYVDLQLKYWPLVDDPAKFAEGRRLVGEIQAELWKHTTEAAKEAPTDITATFIESLNETIDTDGKRIAAMRAGIPSGVWLLLIMVACVRLYFDQLWWRRGRGAVEIGQCVPSAAHHRSYRLDLRYLSPSGGPDPNQPAAA